MYLIVKLNKAIKASRYSGKGDKAFEEQKYKKAIEYYHLALQYTIPNKEPQIFESIAFAYYNLGNFFDSLLNADTAITYYREKNLGHSRVSRLQELIRTITSKLVSS